MSNKLKWDRVEAEIEGIRRGAKSAVEAANARANKFEAELLTARSALRVAEERRNAALLDASRADVGAVTARNQRDVARAVAMREAGDYVERNCDNGIRAAQFIRDMATLPPGLVVLPVATLAKVRKMGGNVLEFLADEFGNSDGHDWANERAGNAADELDAALALLEPK